MQVSFLYLVTSMIEIPSRTQNFSDLMPIYEYFIVLYNMHLCRRTNP